MPTPVVLGTALLTGLLAQSGLRCQFPGTAHECAAAAGKAAIEWRESTSEHPHQLWLRRGDQPATKLLEFGRHVDVLWAPDGRTIAITDHQGSSDSVLWIARVERTSAAVNIEDAFIRTFGKRQEVIRRSRW